MSKQIEVQIVKTVTAQNDDGVNQVFGEGRTYPVGPDVEKRLRELGALPVSTPGGSRKSEKEET